jgi:hypothetical protein
MRSTYHNESVVGSNKNYKPTTPNIHMKFLGKIKI